jgi:hypothetical protein
MATTPEQAFVNAWRSDFDLILQQRESRLWNAVTHGTQNSLLDMARFIGALDDDDTETTTRHGDTTWTDIAHTARAIRLAWKDKAIPLDKADLQMMGQYDPTNRYIQAIMGYFGRWLDRKILSAMNSVALTGQDGSTSVNMYDSGESRVMKGDGTIATAGSDSSDTTATNLTLTKLNALGNLFVDACVPQDDNWFLAVNDTNVAALLLDTTFSAQEVMTVRDIANRRMGRLLNFNFIVLPNAAFTLTATAETDCIRTFAWHRAYVQMNTGSGAYLPEQQIGPRADKKYTQQVWAAMYAGGTRLQGPGVIAVNLKKL